MNVVTCTANPGGGSPVTMTVNVTTGASFGAAAAGGSASISTDVSPLETNGSLSITDNHDGTVTVALASGNGIYLLQRSSDGGPYATVTILTGDGSVTESIRPDVGYSYQLITVAPGGAESAPYGAQTYYTPYPSAVPWAFNGAGGLWYDTDFSDFTPDELFSPTAGPFGTGYTVFDYGPIITGHGSGESNSFKFKNPSYNNARSDILITSSSYDKQPESVLEEHLIEVPAGDSDFQLGT